MDLMVASWKFGDGEHQWAVWELRKAQHSTGSTTQGSFELKRVEVEGIGSLLNIVLMFC